MDAFRIGEDELKDWGYRVTQIRKSTMVRAAALDADPPAEGSGQEYQRTTKGQKHSKPGHNPDGLQEKELR